MMVLPADSMAKVIPYPKPQRLRKVLKEPDPLDPPRRGYVEMDGEKWVCTRPHGDCIYDDRQEQLPDLRCKLYGNDDEGCYFEMLVCDDHEGDCNGKHVPHPQYNPLRKHGFKTFCKDWSRLENKADGKD